MPGSHSYSHQFSCDIYQIIVFFYIQYRYAKVIVPHITKLKADVLDVMGMIMDSILNNLVNGKTIYRTQSNPSHIFITVNGLISESIPNY